MEFITEYILGGWGVVVFSIIFFFSLAVWLYQTQVPEYTDSAYFCHLEGIKGYPYGTKISAYIKPDKKYILFSIRASKNEQEIILPFQQIEQINYVQWEKTVIKERSPMGEAFIGGLIGGDTMAVVSAIDAKGGSRAEDVKIKDAMEILYHPQGDFRTTKRIVLGKYSVQNEVYQFARSICKHANLPGPNFVEPKPKGPTYL